MNVNETTPWAIYLRALSDNATNASISITTGIPAPTLSRWFTGDYEPKPRQVVQVAHAYKANPLSALVAAGYLDADEVDLAMVAPRRLQLREFTELEIAEEMVRRIAEGQSVMIESPLADDHPALVQFYPDAPVTEIRKQRAERGPIAAQYETREPKAEVPVRERIRAVKPKPDKK